jgi:hypothetical protein
MHCYCGRHPLCSRVRIRLVTKIAYSDDEQDYLENVGVPSRTGQSDGTKTELTNSITLLEKSTAQIPTTMSSEILATTQKDLPQVDGK